MKQRARGCRAVVVGFGPRGSRPPALLARDGWEVDVYESNSSPGDAAASTVALGEGTLVDLSAAGDPYGVALLASANSA